MKRFVILLTLCFCFYKLQAQSATDTVAPLPTRALVVSGYIEAYYGYDFSQPTDGKRPGFVYSYNRHNEVTINLAYLKAAYNTGKVRANLALMTGTYANANLAAEPGVLKNIYEANIGVKISKKEDIWIDAGVMPAHVGFEGAVGKDCRTLTRSLAADGSPYYEAGVRLGYTSANEKLYMAALLLNGWQRIQRPADNNSPAGGTQITYRPSSKVVLNYSTFIGNDKPNLSEQIRMFHDVYALVAITPRLDVTLGFDYGMEEREPGKTGWNRWYVPTVIARYKTSARTAVAARAEYFRDENEVIISSVAEGFKTFGYSLNFDLSIWENAMWRIEGKVYSSDDNIFWNTYDNAFLSTNILATTSLAIWF